MTSFVNFDEMNSTTIDEYFLSKFDFLLSHLAYITFFKS